MKTQIITLGMLLVALSFTSCKNNETAVPEAPVVEVAPTPIDSTNQAAVPTAKDSANTEEKEENEANEKNEK